MSTTVTTLNLDAPIDLLGVDADDAVWLYGRMCVIRAFENRVNQLFLQGKIPGTIHLSLGQEACAVGACAALDPSDWITITHRGHGQALAKGVTPDALMAELFARETGCCRGVGGSLHVGDVGVGALPAIAIVGAAIPIAAGLAYAFRHQDEGRAVLSFLGDGAVTEGDAHEGFNLAALWGLPVVYLCENNLYSVSTRLEHQASIPSVAERVSAYGMRVEQVDGNNVVSVREAARRAVKLAKQGKGPALIECLTYRQGGHKRDDPATYRPRDEVEQWLRRDPLARMRAALVEAGLTERAEDAERKASAVIDQAVEFAVNSPAATGDIS